MPEFHAQINNKGDGFEFPPRGREKFLEYAGKNKGRRVIIKSLLPESRYQRKFYHGAVLALWAYLDGKDYTDDEIIDDYHEIGKMEFNAKIVKTKTGTKKIGGSTRGKLNEGYLERVIENLEKEYGVDRELCLNPKDYKYFKDKIFMEGKYNEYLDYLKDLNRLPTI